MAKWTPADMPALDGKVAVVTGANSGLGYYTALELVRKGATVVMACRSQDKGDAAIREIKAEVPDAQLTFMPLDLADLDSIARFAVSLGEQHPVLHSLYNNAGVMALPLCRTRQGFEMQIGTNHLGHFALTARLMPLLRATPGARIIITSSMAHTWTKGMDLDDLNWERKKYRKWDAYGKSKLANLLFTYELQRRLAQGGIDVISVAAHPGYAATNLQTAGPDMAKSKLGHALMSAANTLFAQPAHMGAYPQLYAGTMPAVQGGEYYGPDGFGQNRGYPKRVGSNKASRDLQVADRLWSLSEELTGTTF